MFVEISKIHELPTSDLVTVATQRIDQLARVSGVTNPVSDEAISLYKVGDGLLVLARTKVITTENERSYQVGIIDFANPDFDEEVIQVAFARGGENVHRWMQILNPEWAKYTFEYPPTAPDEVAEMIVTSTESDLILHDPSALISDAERNLVRDDISRVAQGLPLAPPNGLDRTALLWLFEGIDFDFTRCLIPPPSPSP